MHPLIRTTLVASVAVGGLVLVAGCATSAEPGGPGSAAPSTIPSTTVPSADASDLPTAAPSTDAPSSSPSKTTGPSVRPAETTAALTVVYSADGGARTTWTLTCSPTGGTHPDAAAACAALAAAGTEPFAAPSPDEVCTQVYGGPQTATVTGTIGPSTVDAAFSRTNGCQIGRWSALEGLLPKV